MEEDTLTERGESVREKEYADSESSLDEYDSTKDSTYRPPPYEDDDKDDLYFIYKKNREREQKAHSSRG